MTYHTPILEVKHLYSSYSVPYFCFFKKRINALAEVNFNLYQGETLAITGDAGSGKSTLLKLLNGQDKPNKGEILIHGKPYFDYDRIDRVHFIRMFYSNPETSINPHNRINMILSSPLKLNTDLSDKQIQETIIKTLEFVGLAPQIRHYYPSSLTNYQRLRLSLAQALILNPKILIVDSSIERLDPQLKAHFINLLLDVQEHKETSIIICLNDLGLIGHIADKILILNHGIVEEEGKVSDVLNNPKSEFTKRLLLSYHHEYRASINDEVNTANSKVVER